MLLYAKCPYRNSWSVTKKLPLFVLLDRSVELDVMTRRWEAEQGKERSSLSIYNEEMYFPTCVSLFLSPSMHF